MTEAPRPTPKPERRSGDDRRGYFRGGRRETDWPAELAPLCPRCGSPEARLVEGTPHALFWECHSCRKAWTTTRQGAIGE